MTVKIKFLLSCLPLIFVLSCGGGGGGSGNGGAADDGGNNSGGSDNNALNPGLSGKFFFTYNGENAYTMDVETGEYRLIPNTDWASQRDRFPGFGIAGFSARPVTNSNTEFVVLAASYSYGSEVALEDYNGNYLGQLHISGDTYRATMSQDRQYIALFREAGSVSDIRFEIYDWNSGAKIDQTQLDYRNLFWLPDNRILYSEGRTFYITKPVSTETDYTMTLPDPGGEMHDGVIGHKALSPDGSQIAFTVGESEWTVDDLNNHRLYMSNIDGANLRLVATTPDDPEGIPRISNPTWSPDGRWLFVKEGHITLGPTPPVPIDAGHIHGDMYVLPTEDMGKVFYLSTDDSQRSPEVRLVWRFEGLPNEGGSGVTTEATSAGRFIWISD
jgi:Tol biopolymer transport system component